MPVEAVHVLRPLQTHDRALDRLQQADGEPEG
jgi:hypothetical protein